MVEEIANYPENVTLVEIAREPGNPHHITVTDVPIDGWIPMSNEVKEQFDACGGYCNLTIENDVLVGVVADAVNPLPLYEAIRTKTDEISAAKASLTESDYKVLKAYEAAVKGEESPYDMTEVIADRDAKRDAVNAAEAAIVSAREELDAYYANVNEHRADYH